MRPSLVIRVTSDNFFRQLFTLDAYEELCNQMSTGDYHTHMKEITRVSGLKDVITLKQMNELELLWVNS